MNVNQIRLNIRGRQLCVLKLLLYRGLEADRCGDTARVEAINNLFKEVYCWSHFRIDISVDKCIALKISKGDEIKYTDLCEYIILKSCGFFNLIRFAYLDKKHFINSNVSHET